MTQRTSYFVLFIGVLLCGSLTFGQDSLGAGPKKPRTPEDYRPGTLKGIVLADEKRDGLLPFSVSVTYTASVRPISRTSNDALHEWTLCCAGNPDHYKGYIREMRFVENGAAYWLAVEDGLIADFQKELKIGEPVDLFLIQLNPRETKGKRRSVLLVERFQKTGTDGDQLQQSLDWITSNLSSYAEKEMNVEIPGPCQLKITDLVNSASLTKADLFVPLKDLDSSKVSVQRQQDNDLWGLWLHTTGGKNSIRFMLYQGGPAEGGQTGKYSLTFRDREKAEAMAQAFRRTINLCSAAKSPND